MRRWAPPVAADEARGPDAIAPGSELGSALGGMVRGLGEPGFSACVLQALQPLLPAASWSVYRTGPRCRPRLFMSASLGIRDTTRDCWWAYLSGPYLQDQSWLGLDRANRAVQPAAQLCHVTAAEVGGEHRARVYDAHGMVERVSVVEREDDDGLFAINFYRHEHQRPFADAELTSFAALAGAVLELVRKQIVLLPGAAAPAASPALPQPGAPVRHGAAALRERLSRLEARLTARELDVCVRLLQGMTQDGIACDLGLSVATVKTYRNRAFERLDIHFRNELFALLLAR